MPSDDRTLWALPTWLDSWSGIGRIAVGMARQGYDLQLTRHDEKAGARPSTPRGWNTARRARPAPGGSARRGTRRSTRDLALPNPSRSNVPAPVRTRFSPRTSADSPELSTKFTAIRSIRNCRRRLARRSAIAWSGRGLLTASSSPDRAKIITAPFLAYSDLHRVVAPHRSVSKSSRSPLRGICVHSGRLLSS
jgi:hypothetical protein